MWFRDKNRPTNYKYPVILIENSTDFGLEQIYVQGRDEHNIF